jgi:ParB family chromosome partitioning protein
LGGDEDQQTMIEQIERGGCEFSAAYINDTLIDERPAVALAIFPLEQYTGTMTTDLFAEHHSARRPVA